MKVIDKATKKTLAEIITNKSMTTEEVINLMEWTVDGDGDILSKNKIISNIDNIEMIY